MPKLEQRSSTARHRSLGKRQKREIVLDGHVLLRLANEFRATNARSEISISKAPERFTNESDILLDMSLIYRFPNVRKEP